MEAAVGGLTGGKKHMEKQNTLEAEAKHGLIDGEWWRYGFFLLGVECYPSFDELWRVIDFELYVQARHLQFIIVF